MATVEELRDELLAWYENPDDKYEVESRVYALIAAANEEGCDDGWAASKMLWTRMQEWNEEWQKENPKERSLTLLDAMDLIEWKIAKARAEGAEQERERIRKAADHYEAEDELPYAELVDGNYVGASCEIYVIPASVLAPAPKEEGK